jgi:hypothetical protein
MPKFQRIRRIPYTCSAPCLFEVVSCSPASADRGTYFRPGKDAYARQLKWENGGEVVRVKLENLPLCLCEGVGILTCKSWLCFSTLVSASPQSTIYEMAEPESSATTNVGQEPEPTPIDPEVRSIFDGRPTDTDYALSGY